MIFNRIVFENYGLFAGRNEFDLRPRTRYGRMCPIVLFGGKNGAGKTTFLDAIRLALYGRQGVGSRLTDREYHEVLGNKIHRQKNSQTSPRFARVGIEFEFVTGGEKNQFYVERSWLRRQRDTVDEYFRVEKDGKLLDEVSAEHWESFIADVVPERLSQLFFFDGEKIKLIAEDISGNAAICRSIHSLLGLDLVERLKADLSIFTTRIAKNENPDGFEKELTAVQTQIDSLESKTAEIDEKQLPPLRTEQHGLQSDVNRLETALKEQGGTFADERDKNIGKRNQFEITVAEIERRIRYECDAALPFALCPSIRLRLIEDIEFESRQRKSASLLSEVQTLRKSIDSALHATEEAKLSLAKDAVAGLLDDCFASFTKRFTADSVRELLHHLSDSESAQLTDIITNQAHASCRAAIGAIHDLERANRQLHETKRRLRDTPDQEVLQPTFAALADAHQKLGATNQRIAQLQEDRTKCENQLAALQRQKERILERLAETTAATEKLEAIKKILPALDKYRERLTKLKIASLESEITECFNRLARKTDFIRNISIDPNTFAVHVHDKHGQNVPKAELSSGEKQMFAIAMLWGLAKTSGRALPVVVDTPLGRLDSDHRRNLIEHYFPHASQQVILLSTDTEVDQPLFEALSPHISHCYHLRYDETAEATVPEKRYFWRTKEVA